MKTFKWCDEKYAILDKENFDSRPKDEIVNLFYKTSDYKSNDITFQYRYIGCIMSPEVKFSPSGRIARINGISIAGNVVLAYAVEEVEE